MKKTVVRLQNNSWKLLGKNALKVHNKKYCTKSARHAEHDPEQFSREHARDIAA
jgi:hypothetical protein